MPGGLTSFELWVSVMGIGTGVFLSLLGMKFGPIPLLLACGVYWITTQYVINSATQNLSSESRAETDLDSI